MSKDYLAHLKLDEGDKLDSGVKGMKWGVRKDRYTTQIVAGTGKHQPGDITVDRDGKKAVVTKVESASKEQRAKVEEQIGRKLDPRESVSVVTTQNKEQAKIRIPTEETRSTTDVNNYINRSVFQALSTKGTVSKARIAELEKVAQDLAARDHDAAAKKFTAITKKYDKEIDDAENDFAKKAANPSQKDLESHFNRLAKIDDKYDKQYEKVEEVTQETLDAITKRITSETKGDVYKQRLGLLARGATLGAGMSMLLMADDEGRPVNDYIGSVSAKAEDHQAHGIKGMKWGVRRSSSELREVKKAKKEHVKAAVKEAMSKAESGGHAAELGLNAGVKAVKEFDAAQAQKKGNIQDNVESSPDRYARLAREAKAGGASKMTEQDLKFFNARTEALAKINKLNQKDPDWLKKTAIKVIQSTAEKQLQTIADGVAKKYISTPILGSIGIKPDEKKKKKSDDSGDE